MIRKLHDCVGAPLRRFDDLTVQRFNGLTAQNLFILCVVVFPLFARAQTSLPDTSSARSVSGQFIVTGAPSPAARAGLAAMPEIATNTDFVRLEPALLAVSAERIKVLLGRELNPELRGLDLPHRRLGKFFSRCTRRSQRMKVLPSSPGVPRAVGIIKSGCPTFYRAPVTCGR